MLEKKDISTQRLQLEEAEENNDYENDIKTVLDIKIIKNLNRKYIFLTENNYSNSV